MSFSFTDDQRAIRDAARSFLSESVTSERLRAAIDTPAGMDDALWRSMAEEMGWLGVALPERFGGLGLGAVELAILMEETGRVLAPVPFFTTAAFGAPLIQACASEAQHAALLPGLASGATRIALCLTGKSGRPVPQDIPATLSRGKGGMRLSGQAQYVAHGAAADLLLVIARAPGSKAHDGLSVIALPKTAKGVTIHPLTSLDLTRPYAAVSFDNVTVAPDWVLGDAEAQGAKLRHVLSVAAAMLAAEQLGGTDRVLEMSVDYVKQRMQFGRVIGSFQAIKHMLADMMILGEASRSAAYYAACAIDDAPEELEEAAAIARAYCSDAYIRCSGDAVQAHGGIGFTWEHDAHFFFKRARATASLLGDANHHREIVARVLGLDEPSVQSASAP